MCVCLHRQSKCECALGGGLNGDCACCAGADSLHVGGPWTGLSSGAASLQGHIPHVSFLLHSCGPGMSSTLIQFLYLYNGENILKRLSSRRGVMEL